MNESAFSVIGLICLVVWIAFAVLVKSKGGSGVIAIGGGFVAGCIALCVLGFSAKSLYPNWANERVSGSSASVASGSVFQPDEEAAAVAFLEGWKNRGPAGVTALSDPRALEITSALKSFDGLKSYERLQSASEDSVVLKQTGERIKLKIFSTQAVVRVAGQFMDMRLTIYVATDAKKVFIVVPAM